LAAGLATTPEDSQHTSLHARVEHCRGSGMLATLDDDLSTFTSNPAQEADLWLLPVEDLRRQGSPRAGMVEGCSLSCYLRLVDWTSRLVRQGKASLGPEIGSIFERLGIGATAWEATMAELLGQARRVGSYFGTPRGWWRRRGPTTAAGIATRSAACRTRRAPSPDRADRPPPIPRRARG
jgi:hypothetical protein